MGFGTALPFGLTTRQQNAWMYHGGGIDTLNAFFKDYGVIAFPAGNTGAQMGGWFRNPVEHARRLQGPEDAHPRPRRPGDGAHRRGAAGAARRRHLSGAGARRDRRHRMGRPLRRREARLLQDRQELLLPGLVGAVLDVSRHDQPGEMGRAAEALPGGDHQRGARDQPRHGGRVRRQEPAGAGPAQGRWCPVPQVLRRHHAGLLQGGVGDVRRRGRQESKIQEDLRRVEGVPRRGGGMVRAQPSRRWMRSCRRSCSARERIPGSCAAFWPLRMLSTG